MSATQTARRSGASGSRASGAWAGGVAFALAGVLFASAYLAGLELPLIRSDRYAFLALVTLGWLGCQAGAGATVARVGWSHPVVLAGAALGLAAAAVIVLTLTGWGGPLQLVSRSAGISLDRAGLAALAAIFAAKAALAWRRSPGPDRGSSSTGPR